MKNVPWNVMRHNFWEFAPRMPPAAAAIGGFSFLGFTGIAAVGAYVGVSLVTSWALSALAPKPRLGAFSNSSRGLLVNQKDGISPHDFVYGEMRKGGTITYYETTGQDNKFLHQVIALAGHEVDGIGDIYINDEVVTLDGNGFVTSSPWNSKIRIKKHLGTAGQAADPDLLAESAQITSNFRGRGIAYIYVRYEFDQDVFANGLPLVTAVVRGKKVYDPRTDTTAWSDNAALCVRDYITSAYGLNDSQIDDAVFQAAANICDETVPLAAGGTEKRYTINGVARADQSHGDVLQDMMTACAGSLFWGAGKWKLVVGDYVAPAKVLTLDDLRGPISLSTRVNLQDQFNGVQGTFNNVADRWITTDYKPVTSSVFEAEDGGERTMLDLALPFTTSAATARRLAKLTLFRGREQMTLTAEFGLNAFDVEVGEIIALTNPRYGWTEKEFEVVGWKFGSAEAGDLRVTLTLRETSEAAFDWNAEEGALIQNNTTLPSPFFVPGVGVNTTVSLQILNEKVTIFLLVDVTTSSPEFINQVEVQFRETGTTEWTTVGTGDLGRFEIIDLQPSEYDVRARGINALGVKGPFIVQPGVDVTGKTTPPSNVTGLFADLNAGSVTLDWSPIPDLDLSHYTVRHSVNEVDATFANATTAAIKVPRPASEITLPVKPGTYMLRSEDKSGNRSNDYTSVVVPLAALEVFSNQLTIDENGTFPGALDGVTFDTDALIITDTTTAPSDGEYMLAGFIDTGAPRRFRSRVDVATARQDAATGLWDDIPGLFDQFPGNWDDWTGDVQFADTDVQTFISLTQDDPSGSPVWTPFQQFKAGDFFARAARFMVTLKSTSPNVTPRVSRLTAIVEHN